MNRLKLIIFTAVTAAFASCEDTIDVNVAKGISHPVLDAWITDEPGLQQIKLTQSTGYTDQAAAPIIKDATITLFDETAGKSYDFHFADTAYTFFKGEDIAIGVVGHAYRLRVVYKGETFEAIDTIKRNTTIDSITYKYKTKDEDGAEEDGYYAKFHGRDIPDGTDYYWIRSYRNNVWHRVADDFSVDGFFDQTIEDGGQFILPIQESITDEERPYLKGQTVIVKIRSLTYQSHFFVTQVFEQINAGGLFAKVLENVRCNAKNTTPGGKEKMLGWFGTSAVTSKQKTIE